MLLRCGSRCAATAPTGHAVSDGGCASRRGTTINIQAPKQAAAHAGLLRTRHDHGAVSVAPRSPAALATSTNGTGSAAAVDVAEPMGKDEKRHVLSVFVADEPGLINQVSNVFTQAGKNIESLAVGLNVDTAMFTITVAGTAEEAALLLERLDALEKVLYVEDLTAQNRVERELVLMKVRAPGGAARTEVTELARIFRARILDASDNFMTLAVTGDAGKTLVLQRNLARFGIVQLARTGTVSLKRGSLLLEVTASLRSVDEGDSGVSGTGADLSPAALQALAGLQSLAEQQSASTALWEAKQVISEDGSPLGVLDDSHTLSIEVANRAGSLADITAIIAAQGINVQSLAVGSSEVPARSRITVVIPRDDEGLTALMQKVEALDIVGSISDLTAMPFVARELMIVKVRCLPSQRGAVKEIAEIFHGNIIDLSNQTITLELQGKEGKMIAAQSLLKEYGILEVARTGRVAMPRDSGINTQFLNARKGGQVML